MPLFGGPPNVAKLLEKNDVQGLIKALGYQKDMDVRIAAAVALGKAGDARAVEPLVSVLENRPQDITGYMTLCGAVTEALGQIGDPQAVEPLAAFADKNRYERQYSIKALGAIGGSRAIELLVDSLRDRAASDRKDAAEALDRLAWSPGSDEDAAAYWGAKRKWNKCATFGSSAVEPLLLALGDGDREIREQAAAALGRIGDPRAVVPLIEEFKEPPVWDYRNDASAAAAKALCAIGAPAVDPLIKALKDRDNHLRRGVAAVLGAIGDPRAVEPLIAALEPDGAFQLANTREAIIDALASIGDPRSVDPLLVAMKDEARQTRQAAARALVLIYQSGKMDKAQQAALLAQREVITASHGDRNYGCPMEHSDGGIGVDFPV